MEEKINKSHPLVRVIVVVYHNPHDLPPLLASLQKHMQLPYELVIWDNGGCAEAIKQLQQDLAGKVQLVAGGNGANLGFGKAVNLAAALQTHLSPDSIFLLNPDAKLASDFTIDHWQALHQQNALTGLQVFNDEALLDRQASARNFPNFMTSVAGREGILTKIWPNNPFSKAYLQNDLPNTGWQKVDWVSGSAVWVSMDRWKALGGYDERYFLYVEDVDLGRKAQNLHIPVLFYPDIKVVHHIGGTRKKGKNNRKAEWHHHMGMLKYHLKWGGLWGWLTSPVVTAAIIGRYLLRIL
jgi:N-acetylglucosaminyl-diphospho-decaprenol L-rhamnosyltransferase